MPLWQYAIKGRIVRVNRLKSDQSPLHSIKQQYPVLIIGGGIVGAGVFRDLSLHGIKSLLIDAKDFSSQTSRYSSKMLHGGIRYLENMDFGLVNEALLEKNLWLKLTPHLAREHRFYLPVYRHSKRPLWMIRLGLGLYDCLSLGKNTRHSSANAKKTLEALPGLNSEGLKGAGIYSDAVVDDLKLTLEVIFDGVHHGGDACNHIALTKVEKNNKNSYDVTLTDQLTSETKTIQSNQLVFCTGPFTDLTIKKLGLPWQDKLLTSQGSHLWLRHVDLPIKNPMVMTTADGRVIFVIPHIDKVLVGTTEVSAPVELSDMFDPKPTQAEIDYLIKSLKDFFPRFNTQSPILGTYAGIRPLIREDKDDRGKTSREHGHFKIEDDIHVLVGGKYTTFRTMAQDVARLIVKKAAGQYDKKKTLQPLSQRSIILPEVSQKYSFEEIIRSIDLVEQKELVRTAQDIINRTLPWPGLDERQKELTEYLVSKYC